MAANNPLIGTQIGNYRILAEINSGSFGRVYQGKHIIFEDEPTVAIKLLHAALRSPQEHAEFIKEAQVLKKLNHPYILLILDAGFQDGIPYLVIEYAPGGSLRERLKKSNGKPLPLHEATAILTQIGQALHYAHEQHIIHRDLKPENILFNQAGEALLADFGIAVLLASTRTGQVGVGGTPPYMAPEQFEGLASAKSDQYSLGCIAYELVTGHRPFTIQNRSLEAYWFHHAKVEPTPPTHYHPQLPAHIEKAILTSLAKDRANRHKDIPTFNKALLESGTEQVDDEDKDYTAEYYEKTLTAYDQAIQPSPKAANTSIKIPVAHDQVIQLDANDGNTYVDKGDTPKSLKRYEETLATSGQAIRIDPTSDAYNNRGNTLRDLKRYEEALTAYAEAIHLNPNNAIYYNNKGNALADLKRYEEALVAYNQVIRLDPMDADAHNNKGLVLEDLKRYKEALKALEQAVHCSPYNAIYYSNKGDALRHLKRYEEALLAYDQAIRIDPTCTFAYNGKGNALADLKQYGEALKAFDHAIRLDPKNAIHYYNKGTAFGDLKRYEEALKVFDQAIRLDSNDADFYYNKAAVLDKLGRKREASLILDQAHRLDDNS